MSAIDVIAKLSNTNLVDYDLKYCLVTTNKLPKKINGDLAKPNQVKDFVSFSELLLHTEPELLDECAGVGISIQASNICSIDVDHCFSEPNNIDSIDERGKDILEIFKDTYCEFSFSGTGLRILFYTELIDNYTDTFYIKSQKVKCEYYQPLKSYRYVTITGNYIYNNKLQTYKDINVFLDKYMKKSIKKTVNIKVIEDNKTVEELFKEVTTLYFKDRSFQDLWFGRAPGSGKNESELDYKLVVNLFERITQNKDKIKELFERSPYYKSKDYKHKRKWKNNNGEYLNGIYQNILRKVKD